LDRSVRDDLEQLIALVGSLGFAEYKWLPMELRWTFQRHAEEPASGTHVQIETILSSTLLDRSQSLCCLLGNYWYDGPGRGNKRSPR
jgi:hypothetical protein